MTTTIRDIVTRAYQRSGLRGRFQSIEAEDAEFGLSVLQDMILALPGMAHWTDVEVDDDYTAGENERIRVIDGGDVSITVPEAVSSARSVLYCCNEFELVCEGYDDRAPKDGAKVQVISTGDSVTVTYFYRGDTGGWLRADGLALTSDVPINADLQGGLVDMLALQLGASQPTLPISPVVVSGAQAAESKMRARYGKRQNVASPLNVSGRLP